MKEPSQFDLLFRVLLIKSDPPLLANRHRYCFTRNIRSPFLCFPNEMIFPPSDEKESVCSPSGFMGWSEIKVPVT